MFTVIQALRAPVATRQAHADTLAIALVLAMFVAVLTGSKWVDVLTLLAVGVSLLMANHRDNLALIARSPAILALTGLGCLVLLGMLYTPAPLHLAVDNGLNKYGKLLFGFLLYPLFYRRDLVLPIEQAFLAGVFFMYAVMFAIGVSPLFSQWVIAQFPNTPITWYTGTHLLGVACRFPIALNMNLLLYSLFSALATAMLFQRIIESTKPSQRVLYAVLYCISCAYLLGLNGERTALVLFASTHVYIAWAYFSRAKALSVALFSVVMIALAAFFFPVLGEKCLEVWQLITHWNTVTYDSSLGYRLGFWHYSAMIFKAHPILGAGTGSFAFEYLRLGGPGLLEIFHGQENVVHAHNAFLMVAVQWGIVGLLFLLGWFVCLWRAAGQGGQHHQVMLRLLLVCMFVYGNCNVLFFSKEAIAFIVFTTALLATIEAKVQGDYPWANRSPH